METVRFHNTGVELHKETTNFHEDRLGRVERPLDVLQTTIFDDLLHQLGKEENDTEHHELG